MFATIRRAFHSDANHCSARGAAGTRVVGRVSGARILRMACWSYASIALTSLVAINPLVAATITWGTIQNATGNPSDVVTVGTLFDAVTGGLTATNPVLNGVTFKRSEDHNPADGGQSGSVLTSASFLGSSIYVHKSRGRGWCAPRGGAARILRRRLPRHSARWLLPVGQWSEHQHPGPDGRPGVPRTALDHHVGHQLPHAVHRGQLQRADEPKRRRIESAVRHRNVHRR